MKRLLILCVTSTVCFVTLFPMLNSENDNENDNKNDRAFKLEITEKSEFSVYKQSEFHYDKVLEKSKKYQKLVEKLEDLMEQIDEEAPLKNSLADIFTLLKNFGESLGDVVEKQQLKPHASELQKIAEALEEKQVTILQTILTVQCFLEVSNGDKENAKIILAKIDENFSKLNIVMTTNSEKLERDYDEAKKRQEEHTIGITAISNRLDNLVNTLMLYIESTDSGCTIL